MRDEVAHAAERAHDRGQRKHMENPAPEGAGIPLVDERAGEAACEMRTRPLSSQLVGGAGAHGRDGRGAKLADLAALLQGAEATELLQARTVERLALSV